MKPLPEDNLIKYKKNLINGHKLPDLLLISAKIAQILVEFDKIGPTFLDSNVSGKKWTAVPRLVRLFIHFIMQSDFSFY